MPRSRRLPLLLLLGGLAVVAPAFAGPPGGPAPLQPHVARYDLALHPSSRGGEVAALRGRLEVRFAGSCDGWRLEQSLGFRMLARDGATLEHLAHLDAFEERDGSGFVFNTRTWEDRELVEELAGTAQRGDGKVTVRYSLPDARSEDLPGDTLFPAQHVRDVLAAARAGRRVTLRTVFDGSAADNPFQISTAIGPRRARPPSTLPALAGLESWPVRLAYFAMGAVEPQADFEMGVALYGNGIAGDMVYDYGDFAIDVTLGEVELLPVPACP